MATNRISVGGVIAIAIMLFAFLSCGFLVGLSQPAVQDADAKGITYVEVTRVVEGPVVQVTVVSTYIPEWCAVPSITATATQVGTVTATTQATQPGDTSRKGATATATSVPTHAQSTSTAMPTATAVQPTATVVQPTATVKVVIPTPTTKPQATATPKPQNTPVPDECLSGNPGNPKCVGNSQAKKFTATPGRGIVGDSDTDGKGKDK